MSHVISTPKYFKQLEKEISLHDASGRTSSAAFLIWFLQTIYRLDEIEAQDAVCDKSGDLGFDALTVSDSAGEIVVFQAKRKEKIPGTLGDSDLKKFVGALKHFETKEAVEDAVRTTKNSQLRNLLVQHKVAEKIANGYKTRPIFISNVAADTSANDYMRVTALTGIDIDLWDLNRLAPVLKQLEKEWFISTPVKLSLSTDKFFFEGAKSSPNLVIASVPARELVRIPGIDDTRVFAQNVRLGLGNTRVNKEILESVKSKGEHSQFLTFHNGLTIVSQQMALRGNTLTLTTFSVCNGCQSLLTFYENRKSLTDELLILVRFVRVGEERRRSEKIAYRTNNQNAISLRDLNANDSTQVQLKSEFDQLFGSRIKYEIKRGEEDGGAVLSNEYAGQLLLAFSVGSPWSSHQKYRVFGDLQSEIFRYGVTASHIRLAELVADVVENALDRISNERIRKYRLTRFIIVYLINQILRHEAGGKRLLENPRPYLEIDGDDGSGARESKLIEQLEEIAAFVVTEMNYFLEERSDDDYDYKTDFKSPRHIKELRSEVMKGYEKDKFKKRIKVFALPE